MAIYKCKMCGGDLEVAEGVTVVECEYCGTKQTVPTSNDEEIRNLYNRANLLRRKCEFDKAEEIYEKILLKDEKQSEAYWCVLLCRYGIEYVEDPKTYKRIPTCHRTSFEVITSDEYYKLALRYADPVQKKIYEEEAKYIDGVQKEILALSQKEEPYDVFICYKETDENGKRTEDSTIANDIYYQLTQEGYKVFYAAITLEDKLGSAYEPVIFAALHSSKVMLALGTKPEYFNAVWVKNEWSRFLKLMKSDKTKQLIPCYRGMDAYELPEEFAHLQAQDMSKIGFITDLVRGIKKVIRKEEPKNENAPKDTEATAGASSLLRRMYLFLEDKDWDRAKEYAEKVLDIDPENAEAYLGELLSELKITKLENLSKHTESIKSLPLFQKAYRFADKELKEKLNNAAEENGKMLKEKRLAEAYYNASRQERYGSSEIDYLEAAKLFDKISTYKDSAEHAKQCREKAEKAREEVKKRAEQAELQRKEQVYQNGCTELKSGDLETVFHAKEVFASILGFKDADAKITECDREIEKLRLAKKETIYSAACKALSAEVVETVSKARKDFVLLGDYKDSKEKIAACDARIAEFKEIKKENERQAAIAAAKRKKKNIIIAIVSVSIVVAIIIAIIVAVVVTSRNEKVASAGMIYTLSTYGTHYIVNGPDKEAPQDHYVIPASYHGLPVTEIGKEAFEKSNLKSITIPNTITKIGENAFSECKSLTKVNISDLAAWCRIDFEGKYGSSNPLGCAAHLYLNDAEIKELVIPEGITQIKPYAFYGCKGIQKVTIPTGVSKIGEYAFTVCDNLQSITIPNSVTKIGDSTFYGCKSLQSITIPSGVTTIGASAFNGCDSLLSIVIPDSVTTIGEFAISCDSLQSVTIGRGVTGIGDSIFYGCDALKTVVWNAENCTNTVHRYDIFNGCPNLTNVTIGENVKTIPVKAFYECNKITSITIPNSVTAIYGVAFYGCGLKNVTVPSSVKTVEGGAFSHCFDLESVAWDVKDCTQDVEYYFTGIFESCEKLQSIKFGETVKVIPDDTFQGCKSLTEVIIPNSITTIGEYAFSSCSSLTSITIGMGVTAIGKYAFSYCSKLKNAYFLDPNGWKGYSYSWSTGTELKSSDLSNPTTAAKYLYSIHDDYEWRKG